MRGENIPGNKLVVWGDWPVVRADAQFGERLPDSTPGHYFDLPPVENANRQINELGQVIVGAVGSPEPHTLPPNPEEYISRIKDESSLFAPEKRDLKRAIDSFKKNGTLDDLLRILPPTAVYVAAGASAAAFRVRPGTIWRITYHEQFDTQLDGVWHYNIGRSGVYPDWQRKYGRIHVSSKEEIPLLGKHAFPKTAEAQHTRKETLDLLKSTILPDVTGKPYKLKDIHDRNWGLDANGHPRLLDPGSVIPDAPRKRPPPRKRKTV